MSALVSTFLAAIPDLRHGLETLPVSSGEIQPGCRVKHGQGEAAFNVAFAGLPARFLSAVSNRQYVNTYYCTHINRWLLGSRRNDRKTKL
jgi:hypothetical protein